MKRLGLATLRGKLVDVYDLNGTGMLELHSIDGSTLWTERNHTHRTRYTVDWCAPRDPALQPDECTCRPDGDACEACKSWHNIQDVIFTGEMPY